MKGFDQRVTTSSSTRQKIDVHAIMTGKNDGAIAACLSVKLLDKSVEHICPVDVVLSCRIQDVCLWLKTREATCATTFRKYWRFSHR